MHADAAALKHTLADDLTYTHTGGNTQTKAEFISSLREKKMRYNSIEFEDANARVYGNTAVIASSEWDCRAAFLRPAYRQRINLLSSEIASQKQRAIWAETNPGSRGLVNRAVKTLQARDQLDVVICQSDS